MDKEPCTKFCDVLIRFHEDIKLHSFEFKVSDILHENVQNISPLLFSIFFLLVLWKKLLIKLFGVLTMFHKLIKSRSFQ